MNQEKRDRQWLGPYSNCPIFVKSFGSLRLFCFALPIHFGLISFIFGSIQKAILLNDGCFGNDNLVIGPY
jgi:hypothetical protein